MKGLIPASKLKLSKSEKKYISELLTPFDAIDAITDPDVYIETNAGKYVAGLEMLLKKALASQDFELSRSLFLDLLKMTKIGRAKADVNVGGLSKLRDERDLRKLSPEELSEMVAKLEGTKDDPV